MWDQLLLLLLYTERNYGQDFQAELLINESVIVDKTTNENKWLDNGMCVFVHFYFTIRIFIKCF